MSIRSWWRGCQRRRPGIYLARTEKHRRAGRRLSPRWVDAGVRVAGLVCVLGGAAGWIITHH